MRSPHIDDFVRLTKDIPELALSRGEIGVVRSTWFAPSSAYEVEFHQIGHDYQTLRVGYGRTVGSGRGAASVFGIDRVTLEALVRSSASNPQRYRRRAKQQ